MKEENLMKFVFQTVFLNITILISAIQGDLNDIYAERIKSNYQEVANSLSKRNSLAGWKDVWSPASVCYKRISYELNGFAKTFKVQKKSIRLSELLIFYSDFLDYTVNTRSYDANQGFPVKRGAHLFFMVRWKNPFCFAEWFCFQCKSEPLKMKAVDPPNLQTHAIIRAQSSWSVIITTEDRTMQRFLPFNFFSTQISRGSIISPI